jgi:hypothetical protein
MKSKFVHLTLHPVFPELAIRGPELQKIWVQFSDLSVEKGTSDLELCSLVKKGLIFDRPLKRLRELKSIPSKHLYKVTYTRVSDNPGGLNSVKTREIQSMYEFCVEKYSIILENILNHLPSKDEFTIRYTNVELLLGDIKSRKPEWLPEIDEPQKRTQESTRVYRDREIYDGHFGG